MTKNKWLIHFFIALIFILGLEALVNVNANAEESKYYAINPEIIHVKSGIYTYQDIDFTKKIAFQKKGTFLHVKMVVETKKGTLRLQLTNGQYVTANKYFVVKSKGYQNPKA